jgi:uncharacterized membrane protein HdeD (DUF308 family)
MTVSDKRHVEIKWSGRVEKTTAASAVSPKRGIIGILLSFYLWSSLPITAAWLLGVLLGIQLISERAALGYLAWQVRQS